MKPFSDEYLKYHASSESVVGDLAKELLATREALRKVRSAMLFVRPDNIYREIVDEANLVADAVLPEGI